MAHLNDFVQVYDNVLSKETCKTLIDLFESSDKLEKLSDDGAPNFTQYNLTKYLSDHDSSIKNIHDNLIRTVFKSRDEYYRYIDKRCFPEKHAFEQFRIKRYLNNGEDRFDTHVDVYTYETARRFLSFFWYLNDVDQGGETEFYELTIKPKTGTMVVFPPLWLFPHKGNPPISGNKYLLSTYLHYV